MFLKRLFNGKKKPAAEPPHGVATEETEAAQAATRKHMEAEVADDRERRGAADTRPGSEHPPAPST